MSEEIKKEKISFYKKWWFWVLAVFLLFILVGSSGNEPKKVGSIGSVNKEVDSKKETFKIGDQIQLGSSLLTVTNIRKNWISSNQFDKPLNTQDVYVLVSVEIENKGSSDLNLSGMFDFKLEDANGLQKSDSLGGVGLNKLPSGSLSPNGKVSGDILFEINKNALANLKLKYKPLFSSGKEVVIELQ
jgi:hypothetical protein